PLIPCASPDYLKAHGTPLSPQDLVHHNCMRYVFDGQPLSWEFWLDGGWQTISTHSSFNSDNSEALKNAALAGLGIARLLSFQIREELERQQLITLLPDQGHPRLTIQAVFTHRRNLSPRVQVFLEFLTAYCVNFF
ncbi:MAG: substrate binding domain-containing protein, partial [Cyanobacteria bacterium P01_G01_bin.38]